MAHGEGSYKAHGDGSNGDETRGWERTMEAHL